MPLPHVDRRRFLQVAGGAAAMSALPQAIARAQSIPAHRAHGSIEDVEHVVVLMQENRSFDHYYGTMRGVRGYADPHPARLPNGSSVFHQADAKHHVTLPFRPDVDDLGLAFIQDLDHGWDGTHDAFNHGRYNGWIEAKSTTTMAHLTRRDMPFHYALADAFTICDAYHCSLMGPTDPNRMYLWSGWVGNDGKGGGPVIGNDELGYTWTTYPERLEQAGVSWKIYQDTGPTPDAILAYSADGYSGNYSDNAMLFFDSVRQALPGTALYQKTRTGTQVQYGGGLFDDLAADVQGGTLPQVSWIVSPEAFSEHPNWPVNYGAWYTAQVLDALTSDPEVWARTALFVTYDENDGFFDHLVPPHPNGPEIPGHSTVSTRDEHYVSGSGTTRGASSGQDGPYGLGVRVPMIVVSPWSTGGFVNSETFDHTSVIRFLERRFAVHEPNITPWRRAVAGDLTSCFDFSRTAPDLPHLPSTAAYEPTDSMRHADYVPVPPDHGRLPGQERGGKRSRPLGYALSALGSVAGSHHTLQIALGNTGRLGAAFQVRSGGHVASYTVGSHDRLQARVPVGHAPYDVELHGPDGFYRRFADRHHRGHAPVVEVVAAVARHGRLHLTVVNHSRARQTVVVRDAHARRAQHHVVRPGRRVDVAVPLRHGWYDVEVSAGGVLRHLAGRFHDGTVGRSDPLLG